MKAKILRRGGYNIGQFDSSGGEAFGSVLVKGNPQSELEVSNVTYVSLKQDQSTAGVFGTGRLSISNLPAFTGDVSSSEGIGEVTVNSIGVSSNIAYPKVTVNEKGQVLGGAALIENDIPNLPFTKIGTGKPTDLDGYGITDALNSNGGTISGSLRVTETPVVNEQLVNLNYLDSVVGSGQGTGTPTGTIVYRNNPTTPTGFLKCNGGEVSRWVYPALYSVIGDLYGSSVSFDISIGSGKPWKQQYAFNTEQSGDITGWTTGTNLPRTLSRSQAVVTKNRVYLLGGWSSNSSIYITTVYTAPINEDGTLGTWTTGTSLPAALGNSQAVVTKNRVYLLGGHNGSTYLSTVYTAPINEDGTLGTWTTDTSLPGALGGSQAIVTKNRVYLLGGYTNKFLATVYTAPINEDGTLGTWATGTSLPVAMHRSQAIVTKNRVYLLGGWSSDIYASTVQTAPINEDGTLGTWTTGTSLPGALNTSQAIVTKNRVYLLGGAIGGTVSTVYTAPFSGGLNDYSSFYVGFNLLFNLPNLTPNLSQSFAYIKY